MTALSSFFVVRFCCRAESATTTLARKSSDRAKSMTVLDTVVTGTASRPPTCSAGKAAEWRRTPGLPDRLPTPGGRVTVSTVGGGPSRLSPWSSAAVSWLTTAVGPRAVTAAAAESSKAPTSSRSATSARSAVAYIPTPSRTSSPFSIIDRICRTDLCARRMCAVVTIPIPANRVFRDKSRPPIDLELRGLPTFHGCGTVGCRFHPDIGVRQP